MTDLAQIDAAARTFLRRQLHGFTDFRASSIVLIVANLLPLLGVIFLDWDAFSIVALYWVENVVLGLINVLKLIVAKGLAGHWRPSCSCSTTACSVSSTDFCARNLFHAAGNGAITSTGSRVIG